MRKTSLLSLQILGALFLAASAVSFAADTGADGKRVSLFDGKTLDGWTVLKCEAVVEDGNILLKSGNGLVQTQKKYRDFILEFEWKPLKPDNWDSGVYFRYDIVPTNRSWPPRYQANLKKGVEGDVEELRGAKSKGLIKPGDWNSFKLTVKGSTASMEINGKPAWKADGAVGPEESYVGLQAEVPGGGQNLFRNIYLTELK